MIKLHPEGGVIISWKADCSPQVMTVITSRTTRTEIVINQATLSYAYLPFPTPLLPLFQPRAPVGVKHIAEGLSEGLCRDSISGMW
jgi:hypothetical protein